MSLDTQKVKRNHIINIINNFLYLGNYTYGVPNVITMYTGRRERIEFAGRVNKYDRRFKVWLCTYYIYILVEHCHPIYTYVYTVKIRTYIGVLSPF